MGAPTVDAMALARANVLAEIMVTLLMSEIVLVFVVPGLEFRDENQGDRPPGGARAGARPLP
jgi:hypothetical protein